MADPTAYLGKIFCCPESEKHTFVRVRQMGSRLSDSVVATVLGRQLLKSQWCEGVIEKHYIIQSGRPQGVLVLRRAMLPGRGLFGQGEEGEETQASKLALVDRDGHMYRECASTSVVINETRRIQCNS